MAQFNDISAGTPIYSVEAFRYPDDKEPILLGNIITSDKCLSSKYGDTKLSFKHQWIEDDIKLRPEWTKSYYKDCFCNVPEEINE